MHSYAEYVLKENKYIIALKYSGLQVFFCIVMFNQILLVVYQGDFKGNIFYI
jgi:hypothetical protein